MKSMRKMISDWLFSPEERESYAREELRKVMESDEFNDQVAGRVYKLASIAVLELKPGDVLIVPEDTTEEQFFELQKMISMLGGRALLAINKERIGLLRVVDYGG